MCAVIIVSLQIDHSFSPIAYDFTNPKNLISNSLAFIVLDPSVTCQLSLMSKHTTCPEEKLGGGEEKKRRFDCAIFFYL